MINEKLKLVPHQPGSYQMYNADGVIIYVGKAKDLHKRLNSYFNRVQTGKTAKLVSEIEDFKYIVCNSELESFILEINLIKKFNPKYNILLKDDKSYPYIEYIRKPFPQLKVSRYLNVKKKDKKVLFGPYPNASAARKIVNLLNRIYPLKKCDHTPNKPCLYYHIGECLGYCTKSIDQDKLEKMENEIISFLKGNDKILIDRINAKIKLYSDNLNYEMALELKQDLDYIKVIMDKQKVELSDLVNRDVIGYTLNNGYISVYIMFLRNGKLVGANSNIFPIVGQLEEDIELYIINFYDKHEIPKEILCSESLNLNLLSEILNTKFVNAKRGKKKNIIDMANMNANINLNTKFSMIEKELFKTEQANTELKELLNLKSLNRIDLFDNSNLFGTYSVSGMVVFKNGKPAKNEYRKYKVSVEKNDDYHTMQEVIYRRYYKMLLNKTERPDLIIVDGGINQINACKEILSSLNLNIKVCGLKKNTNHQTNELIDGDNYSIINLDKTSNVFHYLTRMQDEVHRYTINYHRTIRSKGSIASILDSIEGIGPKRRKSLIKKFGTIEKIKLSSLNELSEIVPIQVAKDLKKYLENYSKKD